MIATPVATPAAPPPGGHYAQGIVRGGLVYVSGQLPAMASGGHQPGAPFADQVRQALANMLAVVAAGGGRRDSVLKVTAYIVGGDNWPAFDAVYAEFFGHWRPARTVVPVPSLHHGYLVEVAAIAAVA